MIVDSNVLLCAVDEQWRFHRAAFTWLESALNGVERVGLPWASLAAFQPIIIHPRATANPMTPAEAWNCVSDWLDTDRAWTPPRGASSRHPPRKRSSTS